MHKTIHNTAFWNQRQETKKLKKGPSKSQEQHGPGEAYFISFVNILQETIYKARTSSPLLNVWCSSIIDSMVWWKKTKKNNRPLQLRPLHFNSGKQTRGTGRARKTTLPFLFNQTGWIKVWDLQVNEAVRLKTFNKALAYEPNLILQ